MSTFETNEHLQAPSSPSLPPRLSAFPVLARTSETIRDDGVGDVLAVGDYLSKRAIISVPALWDTPRALLVACEPVTYSTRLLDPNGPNLWQAAIYAAVG